MSALAGLVILTTALLGQCMLADELRGDELFAFFVVMFLSLLGMWLLSLVVCVVNSSLEWLKVTVALNAALILPVLLVVAYANSRH